MLSLPIPWPLLLALAFPPFPSFYYIPLLLRDHQITDYLFHHSWTVLMLSLSILSLIPSLLWLALTGCVLSAASQRNNTSMHLRCGPSNKTAMKQQNMFITILDNTGLVENYESLYPSNQWHEPFSYVKASPFPYSPASITCCQERSSGHQLFISAFMNGSCTSLSLTPLFISPAVKGSSDHQLFILVFGWLLLLLPIPCVLSLSLAPLLSAHC